MYNAKSMHKRLVDHFMKEFGQHGSRYKKQIEKAVSDGMLTARMALRSPTGHGSTLDMYNEDQVFKLLSGSKFFDKGFKPIRQELDAVKDTAKEHGFDEKDYWKRGEKMPTAPGFKDPTKSLGSHTYDMEQATGRLGSAYDALAGGSLTQGALDSYDPEAYDRSQARIPGAKQGLWQGMAATGGIDRGERSRLGAGTDLGGIMSGQRARRGEEAGRMGLEAAGAQTQEGLGRMAPGMDILKQAPSMWEAQETQRLGSEMMGMDERARKYRLENFGKGVASKIK